jgi:hypothetical protein
LPRLIARTGPELLSGAHSNVMATFDGRVVLASRNMLPNPDLRDFDNRGNPEEWTLRAPPRPDGWNVYVRRATRITSSGAHEPLRDTRLMKQNLAKLRMGASFYTLDEPLVNGGVVPDRDKQAKMAPPEDAPRVKVVAKPGLVGYCAGTYPLSYAWVLGGNPEHSPRMTKPAPVVFVTVSQGQKIEVFVSQPPEGVTGLALLMGPAGGDGTVLFVQRVEDVRGAARSSYILGGPFKRERKHSGRNDTKMGSNQQHPPPRRWFGDADGTLARSGHMETRLSYKLRTRQGVTASQQMTDWIIIDEKREGEALFWEPPASAVKSGITGWQPEFLANDGNWYTIVFPGRADGFIPVGVRARIFSNNSGADAWPGPGRLAQVERTTADESGMEDPDSAMDAPVAFGAAELPPGRYRARTTFEADDEESGASLATDFVLRDAGLAAGGAATGVTDQMARIYRPEVQKISNERFTDKDPSDEDIDWQKPAVTGVTIRTLDNLLEIEDRSNAATNADVTLTDPFPLNTARKYTLRFKANLVDWSGGRIEARWRFLDAASALIPNTTVVLLRRYATGRRDVEVTFGPTDSNADVWYPANTAQAQLVFRCVGATGDARNFLFRAWGFGLWYGPAASRKRWSVGWGLGATGEEPRRAPAEEKAEDPYPAGAFCRVVENPNDPARHHNPNILGKQGFEGTISAPWSLISANGGTAVVEAAAAIRGEMGLRCEKTDGTATNGSAYAAYDLSGRTKGAVRSVHRVRTRGTGNCPLVGFSKSGEVIAEGFGTLAGKVTCRVVRGRNRLPDVVLSSLDWSGFTLTEGWAGVRAAASGANFRYDVDDVWVSQDGEGDTDPIPGNYVEYWAPDGTPYDSSNFATGLKWPAGENEARVFSCYAGCQGADKAASLFKLAAKDERGNTLREYAYVVPSLKGYDYWDRYHLAYTTPAGAVYVEVVRNNVADGLIRAMGFQDEIDPGDGQPTRYTNENAASGAVPITFDTGIPGGNPMPALATAFDWPRGRAIVNHQTNEAGQVVTSHTVRWKAADTEAALDTATYRNSVSAVLANEGMRRYARAEVTLSTTDLTRSPELYGVFLDVRRALPVLLDEDGMEFPGGVFVAGMPLALPDPLDAEKEYADGGYGYEELDRAEPARTMSGISLVAFRDSAADAVRGRRERIVEGHGKRYRITITGERPRFTPNRNGRSPMPHDLADHDGYWELLAEGVSARIEREEDL